MRDVYKLYILRYVHDVAFVVPQTNFQQFFKDFCEFISGGHAEHRSRRHDAWFRTEQQFSWLKMILAEDFWSSSGWPRARSIWARVSALSNRAACETRVGRGWWQEQRAGSANSKANMNTNTFTSIHTHVDTYVWIGISFVYDFYIKRFSCVVSVKYRFTHAQNL